MNSVDSDHERMIAGLLAARTLLRSLDEENERLREALREIAKHDLSHRDRPNLLCAIARAALGEENPFEDRWDNA